MVDLEADIDILANNIGSVLIYSEIEIIGYPDKADLDSELDIMFWSIDKEIDTEIDVVRDPLLGHYVYIS